jgi:hypothetical protein
MPQLLLQLFAIFAILFAETANASGSLSSKCAPGCSPQVSYCLDPASSQSQPADLVTKVDLLGRPVKRDGTSFSYDPRGYLKGGKTADGQIYSTGSAHETDFYAR